MKKIFLIFSLFMCTMAISYSQSNAIDKLFSDKSTHEEFNYISISDKMFGSISKSEESNAELKEIIANLKGLKILKTQKNPLEFFSSAQSKLASNGYEELMSVKEKGSNIVFFSIGGNGNNVKELIMVTNNKQSTVIMSFYGNISLDKISKLSKALNLEGADKLNKLEKR